ncbi:tryptophan-rich sensory protein [Kineococcus gynurae]|uniref:Tryptophan-rich sensory protein n=1 Tax=Kineococcus gynurae TaxID=452979 RepID=A0ABV5LS76_9ACTN
MSVDTRRAQGSDSVRAAVVLVSAIVMLVGSFVGSGVVVGTPINEAAGGALAADSTLVAPAGPAFSIWSVVYAGLLALAVYQLLPAQRRDARQRRVGWWLALSMLLNAAWILTVQAGSVAGSLVVIAALLVVLVLTFGMLGGDRTGVPALQRVLLDGTVGLYLGWVSVATVANTAAFLVADLGWSATGAVAVGWSLAVLVVVAGIAFLVGAGRRFAPALAIAWGLTWIAVGRLQGAPESVLTAVLALLVAVFALIAPVLRARR